MCRYWHISRPMVYVRFVKRRRIVYAILIVWLLSASIGFFPLVIEQHGSSEKEELNKCRLNLDHYFGTASSCLSFFLPATLMVLLYTRLYLYARRHVRSIKQQYQVRYRSSCTHASCRVHGTFVGWMGLVGIGITLDTDRN